MKHDVTPVLRKHIAELFQILDRFAVSDRETFVDTAESDIVFQKAVLMCVGYIGELSKKTDDGFRAKYPDINWRRLGTSRNIIFHEYDVVDMEIISTVVFKDISTLQVALDSNGNTISQ